jgi:hypothetical protein
MAFVRSVERSARLPKEQPTEVVCYWSFNPDKSLLQLETKGSVHRLN